MAGDYTRRARLGSAPRGLHAGEDVGVEVAVRHGRAGAGGGGVPAEGRLADQHLEQNAAGPPLVHLQGIAQRARASRPPAAFLSVPEGLRGSDADLEASQGRLGLREGLDEGGVDALAHEELGRAVPEGHELPVHLHLRLAQRRARAG